MVSKLQTTIRLRTWPVFTPDLRPIMVTAAGSAMPGFALELAWNQMENLRLLFLRTRICRLFLDTAKPRGSVTTILNLSDGPVLYIIIIT